MASLITAVRDLLDTYRRQYQLDHGKEPGVVERMEALAQAYEENRRSQNKRSARKYYRQREERMERVERGEE